MVSLAQRILSCAQARLVRLSACARKGFPGPRDRRRCSGVGARRAGRRRRRGALGAHLLSWIERLLLRDRGGAGRLAVGEETGHIARITTAGAVSQFAVQIPDLLTAEPQGLAEDPTATCGLPTRRGELG